MSKSDTQQIQCPRCRTKSKMTRWQSVNGTLDPELRKKLGNTSLIMFECPRCGFSSPVEYELLYHDQIKQFMVWFLLPDDRGRLRVKRSAIEIQPWMRVPAMQNYKLRLVTSYNHLLEKILIFEHQLDDRVIEAAKLPMTVLWNVSMQQLGSIYFSQLADDPPNGKVLVFIDPNQGQRVLTMPLDMYYATEQAIRDKFNPRFDVALEWLLVDQPYAMNWMVGKEPPSRFQII